MTAPTGSTTAGSGTGGAAAGTGGSTIGTGGSPSTATSSSSTSGAPPSCTPFGAPTTLARLNISYWPPQPDITSLLALDDAGNMYQTGRFYGTADLGNGPINSFGEDVYVVKVDPTGQPAWFRHFGDLSSVTPGYSIAVDAAGNVFVAGGETSTPIDFGGGPRCMSGLDHQMFLLKLDPAGQHVYSVCFGAPNGHMRGTPGVAVDPLGNAFFAAEVYGTIDFGGGTLTAPQEGALAVVKLDPAGNVMWARQSGTPGARVSFGGIAAIGAGDVVVTGNLNGSADLGTGLLSSQDQYAHNVYLARMDGLGETVWSKVFQGSSDQIAAGIAVGPTGQIAIAGRMGGSVSFGGDLLKCNDAYDVFVAAFDGHGGPLWSRSFGSDLPDGAYGIAWDANGIITIAATVGNKVDFGCGPLVFQPSQPLTDIALARFDSAGHTLSSYLTMSTTFTALTARGGRTALSVIAGDDFVDLGGGPVPGKSVPIAVYGP